MTATATAPKPRSRKTRSGGISLSGETLRRVIRDLDPAVPARSPKPILQNILLADGLAVGTDLELRIEVPLPEANAVSRNRFHLARTGMSPQPCSSQ